MSFDNPFLAVAAFILVPAAAIILNRIRDPFVTSIPLGAPGGVPYKTSQFAGFVIFLKVLEFTGVLLLFLSAAGPVIKTTETVWLNRGADIIIVLDISPSMAALDMEGISRYEAARILIAEFIQRRKSDNIGLVAVGEEAALLMPPTSDTETLIDRLDILQIGELGDGTALGMGLTVAAYHLDKSDARQKAVILITDGENNAGNIHPESAASLIRDMGISFYVIAAGTAGEVPIDYLDPFTRIRRTGIFDSRYDVNTLRRLADTGGGSFIQAPNTNTFVSAFSFIDNSELTVQRSRLIYKKKSLFFFFFFPAIFLLTAVIFIRRKILNAII